MTLVATQVKRRRGTTAENDAFTGAEGEITVDLGNKELRVHTGDSKQGGYGTARKDFENITDDAKNISNWSSNVSNCITNIPQDIKLEFSNGTLTLKAGSKVYVPNGAGVFDIRNITADQTYTQTTNGQYLLFARQDMSIWGQTTNRCLSGTTSPGSDITFYNTSTNSIDWYNGSGVLQPRKYTFPFALITVSNGVISSIDQVFNGFGYIGSTVFALPGVKGLAPNGRNADGTLSNIVKTLTNVTTRDFSNRGKLDILYLGPDNDVGPWDASSFNIDRYPTPTANKWYLTYSTIDNLFYKSDNGANYIKVANMCFFGKALCVYQENITSFDTYKTFRAVDYSDTEYIAHQATPSNRYIDLTLGASGASYTAPADGYVCLALDMQSNGNAAVSNETKHITSWNQNVYAGYLDMYVPVEKGDIVRVYYTSMNVVRSFKMVFLNGSK